MHWLICMCAMWQNLKRKNDAIISAIKKVDSALV